MKSLHKAGWEAYRDLQKLRAAEIFGRALEIAESIDDLRAIVDYRFCRGMALHGAGRLRQALAVLTPTLQDSTASGDAGDIYGTLTSYIDIAQDLPVSLEAIEKAYAQTENFLRDSGHMDWRHRLLHLRAQLHAERGTYREALTTAEESWALWRSDHPGYTTDTHLNHLVRISLRLRDAEQARRYLAKWETQENIMPKVREIMFCRRQSDLARLEKRAHDAVDWARRAVLAAEQADYGAARYSAVLVRAFISIGATERARDGVGRLLVMRHSECGHYRYSIHLLRGDYHLALARQASGMAPTDDEYGLDFLPPDRITDAKVVRHEVAHAKRAYDAALNVGRWIDEQLQCTLREQEISGRLARVQSIGQRVAFC
jgi:tetratricopeptide (TPR) repeat protein